MGGRSKKFEEKTTSYLRIDYAVTVNKFTATFDVALKCLNIKKGSEITIFALIYISSGNVVLYNYAIPIFVDVDDTLNIDISQIEKNYG